MAKVTMTFTDRPDGTVEVSGEVDPPIEDGVERTPAQETGFQILKGIYEYMDDVKLKRKRAANGGNN